MAISVKYFLSTSATNGKYQVTHQILEATDIDPNVFVYKTATGVFDHFAVLADMEEYLTSKAAAETAGDLFYRQSVVTRTWDTINEMEADISIGKSRIQLLIDDTKNNGIVFGNTTITLTPSE